MNIYTATWSTVHNLRKQFCAVVTILHALVMRGVAHRLFRAGFA